MIEGYCEKHHALRVNLKLLLEGKPSKAFGMMHKPRLKGRLATLEAASATLRQLTVTLGRASKVR